MKPIRYLMAATAIAVSLSASAQKGLNIAGAYEPRFRDLPGAVETVLVNDRLRSVNLSLYHAITLTGHPDAAATIVRLVAKDGASALSKDVRYASGHLYYGFYALPPRGSMKRYIFYLNRHLKKGDKIILVYIEGTASQDEVKKLIK